MWLLYLEALYFLFLEKKVFEKNFSNIKGTIGIIGPNLKISLNFTSTSQSLGPSGEIHIITMQLIIPINFYSFSKFFQHAESNFAPLLFDSISVTNQQAVLLAQDLAKKPGGKLVEQKRFIRFCQQTQKMVDQCP